MDGSLVKLERAQQMLAEAKTLDDILHVNDLAEAAIAYARAAKLSTEACNTAAEIALIAKRKAGEYLAKLERDTPYPGSSMSNVGHGSEYAEALEESSITRQDANRWMQVAKVPEERMQEFIQAVKDEGKELTTAGFLRLAKEVTNKKKTEQEQERAAARAEIAQVGAAIPMSDRWNIYHDDIRTIELNKKYDYIITDPPYPREYIWTYEELANKATKWLKPGGLLIAMAGQSYLDEIYEVMSASLEYYWTAAYLTPGQPTPLRHVNTNTTWKPLLMFKRQDDIYKGKIFGDVFKSDANDKDFHKWGQSESGMYDIISKICLPGQSILDPFCGAGTTGVAALKYGCLFDGIELLEENVNISKARLNDATA